MQTLSEVENFQHPDREPDFPRDSLVCRVERAAKYLPIQGPIEVFVYQNTLHAFEDLPFHEAVKAGLKRYQGAPYLTEHKFRQLYQSGRITDVDLEKAIQADLKEESSHAINGLGTRTEIRLAMVRHSVHVGPDAELRWVVAESDALERFQKSTTQINRARIVSSTKKWRQNPARIPSEIEKIDGRFSRLQRKPVHWKEAEWESFSLRLLWQICLKGIESATESETSHRNGTAANTTQHVKQITDIRPRDLLLHAFGRDTDRDVHDLMIRFCAGYLDQGYSDWILPNRELGFFEAFVTLFSTSVPGSDRWLQYLPAELATITRDQLSAEQSIEHSLQDLGIPEDEYDEFIAQSLLALGGWAGMIWQIESGVEWLVHSIPKGSLLGMLAVQLILERQAIRHLGEEMFEKGLSVEKILQRARQIVVPPEPLETERRAFLLFQVSQMLGWTPLELLQLTNSEWQELSHEVESFSGIERRRVLQEAYELKYRQASLDAIAIHAARRKKLASAPESGRPSFQIVVCLDDREESFRRHLEEVQPHCETFGAAGFFAVVMYYRGAEEGFYKPLCPNVLTPKHYVQEDVGYTFEGIHRNRAELRRRLGLARRAFHTRSRNFLGGMFAGILGSLATVPLVARVLFPHLTSRINRRFGSILKPPPVTQLQLERYTEAPGPTNGQIGYTTDEMADVVVRLLQDIGLTESQQFSRIFIVCGHGSASLNNPHESAYCCGACAGKRGGPNARAFAQMANDWRVRGKAVARGIVIPEETVFVGAYHDTCDDSVVFYDLDRLPASHRNDFEAARKETEEARRRNAKERCRRFASAPLTITANEALHHVEARSQNISQSRPEYDHATNALCLVGNRNWSRGLFLDRRAFLVSYDSQQDDPESSILLRILAAAVPVCAGINLSFYFSTVDIANYGSGTKLPHNLVSLLGVMEGTSSDLRTGVYQQVCEIHEPVRLTFVIETSAAAMLSIMDRNEIIGRLVRGGWIHMAVFDPETSQIQVFKDGSFEPYELCSDSLNEAASSLDCYRGSREHLPFFSIREPELAQ